MGKQRGIAHLLLILVLVVAFGLIAYALVFRQQISNPLAPTAKVPKKQPTVALKTEYQNPFAKSSQYINPFDQYKSPFLNLKK